MEFMKKIYALAILMPIAFSVSKLQADGTFQFKNSGSIDLTVNISHKKNPKGLKPGGKTHSTSLYLPAHSDFQSIDYNDSLQSINITSKEYGTQSLQKLLSNGEPINDKDRFDLWGPCHGAICAKKE